MTFFGVLAAGGLAAMPFLAGPPDPEKTPEIIGFLGRFHPVLLHLPIGVFILILLQELGAIFGKRHHEEVANPALFPLFFGAASAVIAVVAGFLLYQGDDGFAGNALAERHMWGGLAFAVAAILTFILKAWTVATSGNPAFYRLLLFTSVGVMAFASHDGASVTHGENYLTEYAPDPIRGVLGLEKKGKGGKDPKPGAAPAAAGNANLAVYADLVAPIFERRCTECHKASKAKGKLRMDTYEMLVKGGKEGAGLEPGNSAKSNIVIRMVLPEDDEDHMPPEGKTDLEDPEMAVVKWWIDSGADPAKNLADLNAPDDIKQAIAKLPSKGTANTDTSKVESSEDNPHALSAGSRDAALTASVDKITKEYPGTLAFESQQSSLLTFTAVSMRGNLDDAGFKKLEPVIPSLVTLDLSATKVTDQSVALLAPAAKLKLIRLAETGVTDAAVESLLKLPSLESINLYGSKVTDTGVSKLSAMPNLKRLYLWKTAVTPEAIKTLKEKLPKCEIITGAEA